MPLSAENQSSVGACQMRSKARSGAKPCAMTASTLPAGRMPCGPMSPWIWKASEKNALK